MGKQKGFVIPLIIAIVAIFAVGGGYYYTQKGNFLKDDKKGNVVIDDSKIASTADETKDWKTYKSEEYGFEFKYPADWTYRENNLSGGSTGFKFSVCFNPEPLPSDNCKNALLVIADKTTYIGQHLKETYFDLTLSNSWINNNYAYFFAIIDGNSSNFNKIISTFKFTNISTPTTQFKCQSDNDCMEISCVGGGLAHELCTEGKCTMSDTVKKRCSTPVKTSCTPNWQCGWGACSNGYQGMTAVDSNNCGMPSTDVQIACPALARVCSN
jgi:hypothetical protein